MGAFIKANQLNRIARLF